METSDPQGVLPGTQDVDLAALTQRTEALSAELSQLEQDLEAGPAQGDARPGPLAGGAGARPALGPGATTPKPQVAVEDSPAS